MKVAAELKEITQEMASKELVDVLNHNFKELKEASDNKIQVLTNSVGRLEGNMKDVQNRLGGLEVDMKDVKNKLGNVESSLKQIIDHLSGKKLLTEEN